MIQKLELILYKAGEILLDHYTRHLSQGKLNIDYKDDHSPITEADLASNQFICQQLCETFPYPVVSEENLVEYDVRKDYDCFWLLDPLDGTKEFIAGIDEFCICLALINKNRPVVGIIYAPALGELYTAEEGKGFNYSGPKPKVEIKNSGMCLLTSRFHNHPGVQKFVDDNQPCNVVSVGSGIKFGRLARGDANIYLRLEGSSEWDIAAGDIIVREAGYCIIDLKTMNPPLYNKESLRNNPFIVYGQMKHLLDRVGENLTHHHT